MILSGNEIYKQVKLGNIKIDPFELNNINPNSYNYRLGEDYKIANGNLNKANNSRSKKIPKNGLLLEPGKVVLSTTHEIIGSEKFVTSLIGRSSVGRLGLFLQISADLGQLGDGHKWTLELTCVQPIKIYPMMKIGQVSFWVTFGNRNLYTGFYTGFNSPACCMDSMLNGNE